MPRIQIWGFKCSRCEHAWLPREGVPDPKVCPNCKSPYWDRPRRDEVAPEHHVTCARKAHELNRKTVEFALARGSKTFEGFGEFYASDLGDGTQQIVVVPYDGRAPEKLVQSDADVIRTHPGKYRFSCFSRAKPI
jgi:hypothetical protein